MAEPPSSSVTNPPKRCRPQNPEDEETTSRENKFPRRTYNDYDSKPSTSFNRTRDVKYSRPNRQESDTRQRHFRDSAYTFQKLEELNKKDPKTILMEITGHQGEFERLVNSELTDNAMVLVVKTLANVCSVDMAEYKASIMNFACKDSFHNSLRRFAFNLMLHDSGDHKSASYFWEHPEDFFTNAAVVFQTLIESVPSKAATVLPKTLTACMSSMKALFDADLKIKLLDSFGKLERNLELCTLPKPKLVSETTGDNDHIDLEPPDDFRYLSVYPTTNEILSHQGFLRKNLIDKGYRDVNHYLDVQFRLLKEDFVGPLRDGIAEYMQYSGPPKSVIKAANVRVYTNVKFLGSVWINGKVGVLLQFQKTCTKFRMYKRFMYGSLLCLTKDNFQSLSFGQVMDSSKELLQKGQVVVGFERYELGQSYVMVECSVYFEPYYQVLTALQNLDETEFPMMKYIVHLDTRIGDVAYLNENAEVENLQELNTSQSEAYRAGLTKEFVVIQGPPGTGKTFLGLKIANTIIEKSKVWWQGCPILVVCYTNHALDQFLEGIQATSRIVRVGGNSKNNNLLRFTLKEQRRIGRLYAHNSRLINIERRLFNWRKSINTNTDILTDIESNSVIIDFRKFRMIDEDFDLSWFRKASDREIIEWLLGGISAEDECHERNSRQLNEFEIADKEDDLGSLFNDMQNKQLKNKHDIDDDMDMNVKNETGHVLTSVSKLKKLIQDIEKREINAGYDAELYNKKLELEQERLKLEDHLYCLQMKFKKYRNLQVENKPEHCDLMNPHTMNGNDRWQLYRYWLGKYKQHIKAKLINEQREFVPLQDQCKKMREVDDLELMKEMLVVGMTTTAAASRQNLLKNLKSPIVIIEEAAEVLESHVVVSLTSHCQHLILIGDHQQLRPSTSNFYIERHCNFGISLFERMVRNDIPCHTLNVQHRMRPEIASLIVPAIYPKLENHSSVHDFPSIRGLASNVFFIDHRFEEEESGDSSKQNEHEAKFLIALARYLIQNGYEPEDITILAAYSGQMFTLWKEQNDCLNLLEGVRVTVLDNYQGEESKIILLSLVRNNKEGKIGFLKNENRVCVALSRAREGLYMMGNMDLLCANSEIWPKVKDVLVSQDNLGTSLTLRCQIHPDHETKVTLPDDFNNIAEGGCHLTCMAELLCGHFCTLLCHAYDRQHEDIKCKSNCSEILCEKGHSCPGLCWELCKPCSVQMDRILPCGHLHKLPCYVNVKTYKCPTPVKTELPCGHTDPQKPCHIRVDFHKCPFPCNTRVEPCGHACSRTCHFVDDPDHLTYKCPKPCERPHLDCSIEDYKCLYKCFEKCSPCVNLVKKRRACTHKITVACCKNPNEVLCSEKCKRLLPCGHACRKKCGEPCGNCNVTVTKELYVCKHLLTIKCSKIPTRTLCSEKCPLLLPCGHECQNLCKEPCTYRCKILVDHENTADCGHTFKIECNLSQRTHASNSLELLKFCKEPCKVVLCCDHICPGTCGECTQGRIHKQCTEKCGAVLVCGHPCPINCREECQPCTKSCSYKCAHSACMKLCGEPCTECKEECSRKCKHVACKARCGDICTVLPCNEPCEKSLPCGHACVGFCGDPCPPLCRECDREELTEIFFGNEDEDDARFVVLDECRHVFESKGMDLWLKGDGEDQRKIAPKCCPRCKTVLMSTSRYSDHVKRALKNLFVVKEKFSGNSKDNEASRDELRKKIKSLKRESLLMRGTTFDEILKKFENAVAPIKEGRRQYLNLMLQSVYTAKLQIIENIVAASKNGLFKPGLQPNDHLNFLFLMLMRNENKISKQELADFDREVKRWSFIVQIEKIRNLPQFSHLKTNELFESAFEKCAEILFSIKIFTPDLQEEVVKNLDHLKETFDLEIPKIDFQVITAMGMSKGHWFKCPNGHIYAIGECGGAMQIGNCADCGEIIGGSSHRLLDTNAHAGELDGSSFPAYSEEANNLRNYDNLEPFV